MRNGRNGSWGRWSNENRWELTLSPAAAVVVAVVGLSGQASSGEIVEAARTLQRRCTCRLNDVCKEDEERSLKRINLV